MFLGALLLLLLLSFLLLIFNFQHNKNTVFLSALLSIFALYGITHYIVTITQSVFWGALLYVNLTPLYLLSGPLLYFYVRNTLADKYIFRKIDLLHFIPALVLFIGLWPHLSSSFEYKKEIINDLYSDNTKALSFQANVFFNMTENFVLRLSSILLYTFKGLQLLYQYRKNEYRYVLLPPQQKKTTLRWLLLLHCIILCTVLSYGLFVIKITLNPDVFNSALNGAIIYGSAFFLSLIVISLLAFPDILYGFPRRERTKASEQSVSAKQIKNNTKILSKSLDQDEKEYYQTLSKNIIGFFKNNTAYLDPNFKMTDLVRAMEVPQHHISYCLNRYLKQSLHQLKLSYRMQWAASALLDPKYNTFSLDNFANKAGYKSKSAFYNAFKEHHGITPLEHQKLSYTSSKF